MPAVDVTVPTGQGSGSRSWQGDERIARTVNGKGKEPAQMGKAGTRPNRPRVEVSHSYLTEELVNVDYVTFDDLQRPVPSSAGLRKHTGKVLKDISNTLGSQPMKMNQAHVGPRSGLTA